LLNNGWGALTTFALVPIPLFLLMGEVFFQTGLGNRMFSAIDKTAGPPAGRLSYVTVLGGTGFSTLSGSSMGSTALLGSLMVPEMGRRGYKTHMSIGPILGTGRAGHHHPAVGACRSFGDACADRCRRLLIAGVIPGLILAVLRRHHLAADASIHPRLRRPMT
jgi:TRAP-type C4-dicarboxylate transport system permease large subunit